jgi:hypothetical protein
VLAVLALEAHPFQIPQQTPTVTVELLPPLRPEPLARIEPPPQPLQPPKARIQPIQVQKPSTPVALKPAIVKPATIPPPPILRSEEPAPTPPERVQVQRPVAPTAARPIAQPSLQTPVLPSVAPPTPAPVQAKPVEAPPAPAPAALEPTVSVPAAAPLQVQSQSQVTGRRAAPLPVLTNDQTLPGPIEIKPPERPQSAASPAGGPAATAPAGGGAAAAGGGAKGGAQLYGGPVTGFGDKGLHTTLGCLNPETYHLSEADREACLQRVAKEARGMGDLGPNIPPDKKAEYDHQVACHQANRGGSLPASDDNMGLGVVQSLRDCGPGDR